MDGMLSCSSCGAENGAEQQFCGSCGVMLRAPCPNCGVVNPPDFAFCGSCGAPLPATLSGQAAPSEERRRATVMFADLSGWTALAEQLDPEDVKALAHAATQQMGAEVRRFGGTVTTVMGDAIMAVFGAPVAHEDDAERAIRAALAMRGSVPSSDLRLSQIELHIGINTGEGMAGMVGPEGRRDYTFVGDVTNTASRLQSAAAAGEILVGEETHASARGAEYEDRPPLVVKGKEGPLTAWAVVGIRRLPERSPGAPFVGREQERQLLSSVWEQAIAGRHSHLVTVVGSAGVGKSRLIREIAPTVERGGRYLKGRSLPFGETTGYDAFGQQVKLAAGILDSDPEPVARSTLVDHVSAIDPSNGAAEISAHLSILLGFSTARAPDKQLLFSSARRYVEALARTQPLTLVFEDLHWAEPALIDLIQWLVARVREVPLLVVTSARPEFLEASPTWAGGLRYTAVPLAPLSDDQARRLAGLLLEGTDNPATEELAASSGGNPLFLEELASSLSERPGGSTAALPHSIQGIISARLDALPRHERSVLQDAAVVGRIFWRGALQALGRDGAALDDALDALELRDFIRRQPASRLAGDPEYLFKHILTMEVAYATLPRASRRERHGRVARYLELASGDRIRESASVLAHHWKEADEPARAAPYLVLAAEVAARAGAKGEAIALFSEAIGLADAVGDDEVRTRATLGRAWARIDVGDYTLATADLEPLLAHGDVEVRGRATRTSARLAFLRGDTDGVRDLAERAARIATETGDARLQTRATALLGEAAFLAGDRVSFQTAAVRAVGSWDPEERDAEYGYTVSLLPVARYWDGAYEDGMRLAREALDVGTDLSSVFMTLFNIANLGLNLTGLSRYEEALGWFERGTALGREWEMKPRWTGRTLNMHAGTLRELGSFAEARALSEQGLECGIEAAFPASRVSAMIDLALIDLLQGEVGRAEQQMPALFEGVESSHGWHQWLWTGRLVDMEALIALESGRHEEAVSKASEALVYLNRYPRPKYEARASTTLGRALLELRREDEAAAAFQRAARLAEDLRQPALLWPALGGLGAAHEAIGHEQEAETARRRAHETIEHIGSELAQERRTAFLDLPEVRRSLAQ